MVRGIHNHVLSAAGGIQGVPLIFRGLGDPLYGLTDSDRFIQNCAFEAPARLPYLDGAPSLDPCAGPDPGERGVPALGARVAGRDARNLRWFCSSAPFGSPS